MLAREISVRLQTLLIAVGVAFAAGALLMPASPDSYAKPRTVRGTVTQVSGDGTRFTLDQDGKRASYAAHAALRWENRAGAVQEGGRPECVRPGAPGRRAELSLVDVGTKGESEAVVVRIRCLD